MSAYARNVAPETRARYAANLRARRADPEKEVVRLIAWRATYHANGHLIPVPEWVTLKSHRRMYREIARVLGEEIAAQWARGAKRMTPGANDGEG